MPLTHSALVMVSMAISLAGDSPRNHADLNGTWEYRNVEDLAFPPPTDGWKTCDVPGYLRGYDYERAWFRHAFTVPQAMRGSRIELHFGGVKYNCRVYVNGVEVGGCLGGYRQFKIDVTEAIRFGEPNVLLVGCHDWTGCFTDGKVDFGGVRNSKDVRKVPRDKILSPIGGLFANYGIWGDVTLRAHPHVYVEDLFIKPSVRRGELVVEYTLANLSSEDVQTVLRATVEDDGDDVLELPPTPVRLAAGERTTVTVRQKWTDLRYWSHVDPYLYHLRAELASGDLLRTRFGFREFWIEGHKFYLNGNRVTLLATSGWPPRDGPMTRDEIRERWEAVKESGCVAFRTHTQPWRSMHYEVADEVGVLMVIEGAIFNDDTVYRIDDPVFWENYGGHLQAMIAAHKNHPSVVMWSMDNEFHGLRLNDESRAKEDLMRMGRLVKNTDPTRPIMYESDGDPGGVADVIGIHYPHEYPFFTCWPNEAWWLSKPQPSDRQFLNGAEKFFWKKNKPLYIGEFLWIPSNDPSWNTVFLGDDAYIDYREYRNRAKAASWRMQILGYRHFEVGGICPWTLMESGTFGKLNHLYDAVKYSYQPIAAFCHDYDSRFFAGANVTRRVEVFNNVLDASDLTFNWQLSRKSQVIGESQIHLSLGPAGQRMLEIVLDMPECETPTPLEWQLTLHRDGDVVFDDKHFYTLFPRPKLPSVSSRIGLFDPEGTTRGALASAELTTVAVESLAHVPKSVDVLVIGAGLFEPEKQQGPVIGYVDPGHKALTDFVAKGGRVLLLEQEAYPEGLFGLALEDHRSTMTFPAAPGHPALAGIHEEDLKFWRGDHLVTMAEPSRPDSGSVTAIVVSGSVGGIDHAPLLERRLGAGCLVHSQLRLVEKFATEPTAARILGNLVRYLSDYRPMLGKTGLVGGSEQYRDFLEGIGLKYDDLTGRFDSTDLSKYRLLLVRGQVEDAEKLRRFVDEGGNLLVHRLDRNGFANLGTAFDLDLDWTPFPGTVTRVEGNHLLLDAVKREDVYWLQDRAAGAGTTRRAAGMTDGVFSPTLKHSRAEMYDVEDWRLTGLFVEPRGPEVSFATDGTACGEVVFPDSGNYLIGVVARGTPCDGAYPIVRVSVDGKPIGNIAVPSDERETRALSAHVERGRHEVSVAFVNNRSNATEDRNLYIDKVLVAAADDETAPVLLSDPGATACVPRDKGLIVLDQLRWDTEERNTRKAARYACSLMTALGGTFESRLGVTVECEQMTPQPGRTQIRNRTSHMSLASEGYITTDIQVAAAGNYVMELVASGSEVHGIYPLVEARIDGKRVGQFQLLVGGWRTYPLEVELHKGSHKLTLDFLNDLYVPGEGDRNVSLDKVIFHRD